MTTQKEYQRIIAEYWLVYNRSPSYREIALLAGVNLDTAWRRTKLLEYNGLLEYQPPRKQRCRVLVVSTRRRRNQE
jgi:DNA-binding transcriptional regulator YhcF (GntR family)